MTTPRKEIKRDARRLEKAEKAALIDKVTHLLLEKSFVVRLSRLLMT